jgi:hypothetical protein
MYNKYSRLTEIHRQQHVKRRLKSGRKLKNTGVIALDYINTTKNLADQLTKGLSRNVRDYASIVLQ